MGVIGSHRTRRGRRLLRAAITRPLAVLLGFVVLTALALLAAPIVSPTASADPCPDVEVMFARGTFEPPGVGDRSAPPVTVGSLYTAKTIEQCVAEDPICSPTGSDGAAHGAYAVNGMIGQTADFVARNAALAMSPGNPVQDLSGRLGSPLTDKVRPTR